MTLLTVTTALLDHSGLVVLDGELDLAARELLPRRFEEVLSTGVGIVVIDLAEVSFMDAAGLSLLMACRERAATVGARCVLAGARRPVTRIMDLTNTCPLELGLVH